jgi:hypothetical protein
MSNERFGDRNPEDPEYDSVEEFAEFVIDDERETFDIFDLRVLNYRHGLRIQEIRKVLEAWGLAYVPCEVRIRQVRGINSNSHDRWWGKGSCKTHGGSGHEQIQGFTFTEG